MAIIAPSLLAANFGKLDEEIEMINQSEAAWLHLDVMDGVFVPNISFGTPVIQAVQKKCSKKLDVHLMIEQPERYIGLFKDLGADVLTVHYEASTHLHRTLSEIRAQGMMAGVALNPHTPVHVVKDVLELVDLLLIMSVNPGFGGQRFIEQTYARVMEAKALINEQKSNTLIEIDGGVDTSNSAKLIEAGADVLVAGSSVFKSDNPMETISSLKGVAV